MKERVHGHIGIDLPVSGEQGVGRGVRSPKRRAPGPRPVRPYVPPAVRRDGAPAARRPADPAAVERDGGRVPGAPGADAALGVADARGSVGRPRLAAWGSGTGRAGAVDGGVVGGSAVRTVGAAGGDAAPLGRVGGAVGGGLGVDVAGRGCGSVAGRPARPSAGPRLLVARPGRPALRRGDRLRRLLAGLALVLVAAAVVVGLGRIADVAAQSRAAEAPAVSQVDQVGQVTVGRVGVGGVTVTVTTAGTVWDVADRVAPGASGPERAALVDRIVAANALTSMRVAPGTVLRVPV